MATLSSASEPKLSQREIDSNSVAVVRRKAQSEKFLAVSQGQSTLLENQSFDLLF